MLTLFRCGLTALGKYICLSCARGRCIGRFTAPVMSRCEKCGELLEVLND